MHRLEKSPFDPVFNELMDISFPSDKKGEFRVSGMPYCPILDLLHAEDIREEP
jgi:hypothetical protein